MSEFVLGKEKLSNAYDLFYATFYHGHRLEPLTGTVVIEKTAE